MSLNLCFIGAGNLATHLSVALQKKGYRIIQVFSRTENSAKSLAGKLRTKHTNFAGKIDKTADVYFIALKDDTIEPVISQINFQNKLVVHCSGTKPLSVLNNVSKNTGVFYPLQTFSKNRIVDFRSVPVFIEANSKRNENDLLSMARKLSDSVSILNSEKRKAVHISAVFACNFVNHFYTLASEILINENIPFDVLKPLIVETAAKVQELIPLEAQTGPAVRFDEETIKEHLNYLERNINIQELYKSVSKSIFDFHKNMKQ